MGHHAERAGADMVVGVEEFMSQMRATLASTKVGIAIKGAEVRPVKPGLVGKNLSASSGRLMGFSFRETTGTSPATVYLRDGTDNTGDIIVAIQLNPSESTRDTYMPGGLSYGLGLFFDVPSGVVEGSVWINGTVD